MRRYSSTVVCVVSAATVCSALLASGTAAAARTQGDPGDYTASGGTWGTAKEVPGTAQLNAGGFAFTQQVSCSSAGTCSAGGEYTDASANGQAFIANEVNGTWGTAKEVPGTSALNKGFDQLDSLSCVPAAAGNCGAGGLYTDASGHVQAFVAGETNGTWGAAKEVPGTAALNQGGDAEVDSVSCASAGNCSADGSYTDVSGRTQVFVIGETNGVWNAAKEVPGTAALNSGGGAFIDSVSCGAVGNCGAGGEYRDSSHHQQAFVVNETNGTWHSAIEVPGTAALNHGTAVTGSVSCASAGTAAPRGST